MATRTITLKSREHFGRRVPSKALGCVLEVIPAAVRQSVRMAFEGRSRAKGKRPAWLGAAADVRFVGHEGSDDTILHFETPTLGEAAPRLYAQQAFWSTRPEAADTGIDLLADVLVDVAARNADSERFDRSLLDSVARFGKALEGTFTEILVGGRRHPAGYAAAVNPTVVESARNLYTNTPVPQRVRLVGKLDMLRVSTRSFGVILDGGEEIRGVLTDGEVAALSGLMNQRVLVLGKAVYRPSGRPLRVDTEEVTATAGESSFFSTVPKPVRKTFDLLDTPRDQPHKPGVAAIIGKWPGDETDEQVAEALRELS